MTELTKASFSYEIFDEKIEGVSLKSIRVEGYDETAYSDTTGTIAHVWKVDKKFAAKIHFYVNTLSEQSILQLQRKQEKIRYTKFPLGFVYINQVRRGTLQYLLDERTSLANFKIKQIRDLQMMRNLLRNEKELYREKIYGLDRNPNNYLIEEKKNRIDKVDLDDCDLVEIDPLYERKTLSYAQYIFSNMFLSILYPEYNGLFYVFKYKDPIKPNQKIYQFFEQNDFNDDQIKAILTQNVTLDDLHGFIKQKEKSMYLQK